jgi:hypothetical protein
MFLRKSTNTTAEAVRAEDVLKYNRKHGKDGKFAPASSSAYSAQSRTRGLKRSSDSMSTEKISERGRGRANDLAAENRITIRRGSAAHSTPNQNFRIVKGVRGVWSLNQTDGMNRNHGPVGGTLDSAVKRAEEIIAGITLFD